MRSTFQLNSEQLNASGKMCFFFRVLANRYEQQNQNADRTRYHADVLVEYSKCVRYSLLFIHAVNHFTFFLIYLHSAKFPCIRFLLCNLYLLLQK